MQAPRLIVTWILDELESWDPDLIERFVVRGAGVTHADGSDPKVFERRHPLIENRNHGGIVFGIDTQQLSSAVVEIEIAGNQRVLEFDFKRSHSFPHEGREGALCGLSR